MPSLKGKLLGLPVWVWGVAIGGGILAVMYLRRRDGSSGADAGTNDETDASADGSDASGVAGAETGTFDDSLGGVSGGTAGFNEALPPDWTTGHNAHSHLDPALKREIRRFLEQQETERKKDAAKRKREKNKAARATDRKGTRAAGSPVAPVRHIQTHFVP